MSLDVRLIGASSTGPGTGIFVRENGGNRELTRAEWDALYPGQEPVVFRGDTSDVFSLNITHNLGPMAEAAGLYDHLWRPDEIAVTAAEQLVGPLEAGIDQLLAEPNRFRALNPSNGWGSYEGLLRFVWQYLKACRANPHARVEVWR